MPIVDRLKRLLEEEIVIFDGAIGSEIYKRHFFLNVCFEELNLSAPKVIGEIHNSYYKSGAKVMTTNTFGANRNKLSKYGLINKVTEINKAGVILARENSSPETLIAGSVGPIGDIGKDQNLENETYEGLKEQSEALIDAGVDFLLFETVSSIEETKQILAIMNETKTFPFVISFIVDVDCKPASAKSIRELLQKVAKSTHKPTAIGLNCGLGPDEMLQAIEKLMPICSFPVIIQPNVGAPKSVDNRMIYVSSPEYIGTYAMRYVNLGVRGVGGCCGTTPEHIHSISKSVKPYSKHAYKDFVLTQDVKQQLQSPTETGLKSKFGRKLANREWINTIEILPPKGYSLSDVIKKAQICQKNGIDAINIPDGPRASSRVSPLITALMIQQEAKIESILHFCCRDRNLIGMQSDLLGCASVGIRNILFITGDPPKLGQYPNATAVFDTDSIGLVKIQSNLNMAIDMGGTSIGTKTEAVIGVGADPNALDIQREIDRTIKKVKEGAEFIITQPVFNSEALIFFIKEIRHLNIPLIAGVWPLSSLKNAEFMKKEVPGVVVPDFIIERMSRMKSSEEQREEGIKIAKELIEEIRPYISGIQVSAPLGNVEIAIRVVKETIQQP